MDGHPGEPHLSERPLFVFGSMLDEDVLRVVLDRPLAAAHRQPARLDGFRRLRLPDESYPVLVVSRGGAVRGDLLWGLSSLDHARIAFYESEEYGLADCRVRALDSDVLIEASFYAEGITMPGASAPWELDWWRTHHKTNYLVKIARYMELFGVADIEEAERLWTSLSNEVPDPAA